MSTIGIKQILPDAALLVISSDDLHEDASVIIRSYDTVAELAQAFRDLANILEMSIEATRSLTESLDKVEDQ